MATLEVMQRQGIAATTVRDVAAVLGTSSGLIHHYVASMDELVGGGVRARRPRGPAGDRRRRGGRTGPLERLRLFFDTYARSDTDTGMQLWLDAWAEAARRPVLQRISRRLNEEWQALLCEVIADGDRAGVLRCDDPAAAAWRMLSLLDGLTLQAVAHGDAITTEQAGRWSREGAERELGLAAGTLASGA